MKCTRCKATAVVALPSHNAAFCPECFLDFFSKQVDKGSSLGDKLPAALQKEYDDQLARLQSL